MKTLISIKLINIENDGLHLSIKARINNKNAHMLIDTGASTTVFDRNRIVRFVNESKFDLNDKLSTGLGTNSMQSHTAVLKKLKLGNIEIKNYKTVLLDLTHVNQSYEKMGLNAIDGVLGSDVLNKYKAVIDYYK